MDTIDRDWILFFGATAITWTGLGTNYDAWRQGLLVAIEEEKFEADRSEKESEAALEEELAQAE